MELIYANAACSLAVHIMLEELGLDYEALRVDLKDKKVLESYNSLGYVPVLVLDNGEVMLEAISILQYLSLVNNSAFMPKDSFERAKCIEWLTFISTELHKLAAPLFHRSDLKNNFIHFTLDKIEKRLQVIEDRLFENAFLMGNLPSVADMYAIAILRVLEHVGIPLDHLEAIKNYKKNLEESPIIKKVLKVEANAAMETKLREGISRRRQNYSQEKRH